MTDALSEPLNVDKRELKIASGSASQLTKVAIYFHDKPSADPIKVANGTDYYATPSGLDLGLKIPVKANGASEKT